MGMEIKKIPRLGDFYLSVAVQQLNDRQAVVEFLVGTQGLEPWTQ